MKYSERLRWFSQIKWEEGNCLLDCLVDIAIRELDSGYFLIRKREELVIYSAQNIQLLDRGDDIVVIGKILKRDHPLKI